MHQKTFCLGPYVHLASNKGRTVHDTIGVSYFFQNFEVTYTVTHADCTMLIFKVVRAIWVLKIPLLAKNHLWATIYIGQNLKIWPKIYVVNLVGHPFGYEIQLFPIIFFV